MTTPTLSQIDEDSRLSLRRVETSHLHGDERCDHFDGSRQCRRDAQFKVNARPFCEEHGKAEAVRLLFRVHGIGVAS